MFGATLWLEIRQMTTTTNTTTTTMTTMTSQTNNSPTLPRMVSKPFRKYSQEELIAMID
jgi:hypothetical protein